MEAGRIISTFNHLPHLFPHLFHPFLDLC